MLLSAGFEIVCDSCIFITLPMPELEGFAILRTIYCCAEQIQSKENQEYSGYITQHNTSDSLAFQMLYFLKLANKVIWFYLPSDNMTLF